PFPVPELPPVTVTPGLCVTTSHGQPVGAVTTITTVPPVSGTVAGVVAEYVQLASACVIAKVWPFTLTLPVRAAPVWLAARVTDTTAEAVPDPLGTVI